MESQTNNISSIPFSPPKKIYKWYLILSIIYSSILVLTGIISLIIGRIFPTGLILPNSIGLIQASIVATWFVISVVMFILIFAKKIEKIALLLLGFYIFEEFLKYIISVVASAKFGSDALLNPNVIWFVGWLILLFQVIPLGIAIYLISRK